MKRVLLLVFLMVSLAELALERDRIYLLFSTAALDSGSFIEAPRVP
ncbi:MAG: hypothetical protein WB781_20865 [Candidatus Sulfotelmatobacter sp.]